MDAILKLLLLGLSDWIVLVKIVFYCTSFAPSEIFVQKQI